MLSSILSSCPDCQDELVQWQQLATAVQDVEVPLPSPRPEQFAALINQIDAAEPSRPSPHARWRLLWQRWAIDLPARTTWRTTPTFARLALAAQAAVIVLLAGMIMWRPPTPSAPLYQTLSSDPVATEAPRGHIKLIFAPDTTIHDLQQILTHAKATVISGPSPIGAYTVEVRLDSTQPTSLTSVLEIFRGHTAIELAEPTSSP